MKLIVVFMACTQVGIDVYANHYQTRVVEFTDEQKKLLNPPENMEIFNVIFDENEEEGRSGVSDVF